MTRDVGRFWSYVGPSMAGMLVAGSYSIVDTLFIGWGVGKTGLAAVALTWPLTLLLNAVGDLFGAGGSVLAAQAVGAGDRMRANRAMGVTLVWLTVAAAAACTVLLPAMPRILLGFGATPDLLPQAAVYARTMTAGALFTVWMMAGLAFLRADGRPVLAMLLLALGLVLNILFDWIFILLLGWGAFGAALASVVGQAVCAACCTVCFLTPLTRLRPAFAAPAAVLAREAWNVFRTGLPIFGNLFSVIAMLFLHNLQALRYGGVDGLAAYTLVATLESVGSMLMTGLAAGMQPLVATMYGAGKHRRKNRFGRYAYWAAFGFGALLMLISFAVRDLLPRWIGLTGDVAGLAAHGVLLSSTAFLLLGVIRVGGFYYQSTGKLRAASLLIYGDSCFALPLCLFVLPQWLGMDGIWLAMPVSRIILMGMLCFLWYGPARRVPRRKANGD